ncbi:hypothetical protein FRC17_005239 [Serendipita sp. 399]|nr:hypothetical protein FRC17_005239 [Serendipita sp. 399]
MPPFKRRKWKRVVLVPLIITTIWLAVWTGVLVSETHNMVATRQNLDREAGQHIIARLLKFDGMEKILGSHSPASRSAFLTIWQTDVGWTPVWCQATNDCEPFGAKSENFTVDGNFDIPMKPGRHALYRTKLRIRNNDDPNPSVFNPWIKWGFSYPFDSGVALIDFPMGNNETQWIKGVVLSGFLMNVRIGVDLERGDFCLARETPPCDTLRVRFRISRWRIVKALVIVVTLVNWTVTIAVCTMAVMVIYHILNKDRFVWVKDSEPLMILAAQFGAIFTIPGLRVILPEAPPSDLVAIIPNLFIISFTGSALLVVLAAKKLRNHQLASQMDMEVQKETGGTAVKQDGGGKEGDGLSKGDEASKNIDDRGVTSGS